MAIGIRILNSEPGFVGEAKVELVSSVVAWKHAIPIASAIELELASERQWPAPSREPRKQEAGNLCSS